MIGWLRQWWTPASAENLLTPTIRAEVLLLFDSEMTWTMHLEKVELEPEQMRRLVIGMLEAASALAKQHGIAISATYRGAGPDPGTGELN